MKPDNEGFLQPVIDQAKCVHCGKCEKVCPVLHHGKPRKPLAVYAAKAKDDKLRAGSASGGIFTLLARDVLKRGGVVFGAGFDHTDWRVIHKAAHNEEELDDLRGSKYVQSDVGDTYKESKQLLDEGKEVLYSGCPCQIAALLNFLGKPYPNLTTVDLVCHGVPSPLAWRKYLDDREREADAKITRTLARRYCGWQEFALSFAFANDNAYSKTVNDDTFIQSFMRFWTLRPSCYHCSFRNFISQADITIGDYGNIADTHPEMVDGKGISVVMPLTGKGNLLITKAILDLSHHHLMTIEDICRINTAIYSSHKHPRFRATFYNAIRDMGFDNGVRTYLSRRQSSLLIHLLWWSKRLVINREWNKISWK